MNLKYFGPVQQSIDDVIAVENPGVKSVVEYYVTIDQAPVIPVLLTSK